MLAHLIAKETKCFLNVHYLLGALIGIGISFYFYQGISIVLAIFAVTLINSTSLDDKNNTHLVLNSLPIKRKAIVQSKYIFAYLSSVVLLVIFQFISALFYLLNLKQEILLNVQVGIYGILTVLFITAYFPIYYAVRNEVIRYLLLVFTLFFTLIVFLVSDLYKVLESSNPLNILIVLIAACFLSMISMIISQKIYEEREF